MTSPTPPRSTLRLFPGFDPEEVVAPEHRAWWIERLLEEGDRADLAALTASVREDELRAWLASRGRRRLSHRSLAFWSLVLGAPRPAEEDDPLWPH